MSTGSPLTSFLKRQPFAVLDGGLATELERRGHDLNHSLWSAKLLLSQPEEIRAVHRSYLEAGADCITAASYQATLPGLTAAGLSRDEAQRTMQLAIEVAVEARDEFFAGRNSGRQRPLVAASIGPYGAYLADGSEYTGSYDISIAELQDFHESRFEILSETGADLFACETIPNYREALALRRLLDANPDIQAWVSFCCRDEVSISDGTPLAECAAIFSDSPNTVAVGINCTAPKFLTGLIAQVKRGAPQKVVVVYPNSGEIFDAAEKKWRGESEPADFGEMSKTWWHAGARLIGGCCRTRPEHVRAIRDALAELGPGNQFGLYC